MANQFSGSTSRDPLTIPGPELLHSQFSKFMPDAGVGGGGRQGHVAAVQAVHVFLAAKAATISCNVR